MQDKLEALQTIRKEPRRQQHQGKGKLDTEKAQNEVHMQTRLR